MCIRDSSNDEEVEDDKILSPKSDDRIFDPDSKDYMESDNENVEEQENEMDKNEDFFAAKENNVVSDDSEGEDEMSDEEEDHNIKVSSQFCVLNFF